jgi:hypothetical protein
MLMAVAAAVAIATWCELGGTRRWGLVALSRVPASASRGSQSPARLQALLQLGTDQLPRCDIALMNLLCAEGLPGTEGLNCNDCLAMLDRWAAHIQSETERHLYRFKAHPAEFENSEGYFRMLVMAVVLYEDYSIRYNPARITKPEELGANDHFFANSRDIFLHGLLSPPSSTLNPPPSAVGSGPRLGTCSSMPVLYVALGRRLGYPLKLVTTKAHLFLRWESSTERLDLEATGKGMNRYDDEHFKRWPFPVTDEEIKADGYLKSLNPAEELAVFLSLRGHCLREAGRSQEAAFAYRAAAKLAPSSRAYRLLLADTLASSPAEVITKPPRATGFSASSFGPSVQTATQHTQRETP